MKHKASRKFWANYERLPDEIRTLADKNFKLLKADPKHPSLHFKQTGKYWSVRVGIGHRALGVDRSGTILWIWIGTHTEYDRLIK